MPSLIQVATKEPDFIDSMRALLAQTCGLDILGLIIDRSGVLADPVPLGPTADPIRLAASVGMANLGRELLLLIQMVDPDAYAAMLNNLLAEQMKRDRLLEQQNGQR